MAIMILLMVILELLVLNTTNYAFVLLLIINISIFFLNLMSKIYSKELFEY